MTPTAWHHSVARSDSIFCTTYEHTRTHILQAVLLNGHDVIVEVGCGTGNIIGEIAFTIPCIGFDTNKEFISFCQEKHPHGHCEFHTVDDLDVGSWWEANGLNNKYRKPMVICVSNHLGEMAKDKRACVVDQMLTVAGPRGMCMAGFWNGQLFSHGLFNYYRANEDLFGQFNEFEHVDLYKLTLTTPKFSTKWFMPADLQQDLRSIDVNIPNIERVSLAGAPHMYVDGLAILAWFDHSNTSRAEGYYDSDDSQKFYKHIWGEDNLHVGRYDLLTEEQKATPTHNQVALAQEQHEVEFIKLIRSKAQGPKYRVVDLGCAYAGLLRRLWREGMVWQGTGIDISKRMCNQARLLNVKAGCTQDVEIRESSFLDVSLAAECADLVVSMDALLHVGPEGQRRAMQEAARLLRPGGWIIFSDIMQKEDADAGQMQPIYDRIDLNRMGTVSNYKSFLEECGFSQFSADLHSENISTHFGAILEVLLEKGPDFGISEAYMEKATKGLDAWKSNSSGNITWGFLAAQKTGKVDIEALIARS